MYLVRVLFTTSVVVVWIYKLTLPIVNISGMLLKKFFFSAFSRIFFLTQYIFLSYSTYWNFHFYFRQNLYNTNDKFDYGGFRELQEAQSQAKTSTTLFTYRFKDPGVYVFYLSSNVDKKMVSRLPFLVSVRPLYTIFLKVVGCLLNRNIIFVKPLLLSMLIEYLFRSINV